MNGTEELLWKQFRQSLQVAEENEAEEGGNPKDDEKGRDVIRGMSQFV